MANHKPPTLEPRDGYIPIDGYVWCDRHGSVHDDTLDPFGYGRPPEGFDDVRCQQSDHSKIFRSKNVARITTKKHPTPEPPRDWREYRDPLLFHIPPCAVCGKPVPDAYAMLADATRFCSAACYEHYVRR